MLTPGTAIKTRKLHPHLGLEISGLDVSNPLSSRDASWLIQQFNHYSVLVLRNQAITDRQQIAFSRLFGELETTRVMTAASNPYVYRIANVDNRGRILPADASKRRLLEVNTHWHIDSSYKSPPALASILSGRVIPASCASATAFCSLARGYACLPPEQKQRLNGLNCLHDYSYSLQRYGDTGVAGTELAALQPCRQPLVHKHPHTRQPCLYLSGHIVAIDGMDDSECRSLLDELFARVVRDDTVYTHTWVQDDLVIWDNRSVMHRSLGIPTDEYRRVHRTTVKCPHPLSAEAGYHGPDAPERRHR